MKKLIIAIGIILIFLIIIGYFLLTREDNNNGSTDKNNKKALKESTKKKLRRQVHRINLSENGFVENVRYISSNPEFDDLVDQITKPNIEIPQLILKSFMYSMYSIYYLNEDVIKNIKIYTTKLENIENEDVTRIYRFINTRKVLYDGNILFLKRTVTESMYNEIIKSFRSVMQGGNILDFVGDQSTFIENNQDIINYIKESAVSVTNEEIRKYMSNKIYQLADNEHKYNCIELCLYYVYKNAVFSGDID